MKAVMIFSSVGILLMLFIPMFVTHGRRLKALKRLKIDSPNESLQEQFAAWKRHVEGNILKSNLSVFSLSLFLTPHLFFDLGPSKNAGHAIAQGMHAPLQMTLMTLVFVGGSITLAVMAANHTTKATGISKRIGLPKGYRWIEKRSPKDGKLPSPRELAIRAVSNITNQQKNMIRLIIEGSSIEWAAVQCDVEIEEARRIYEGFYSLYMEMPEKQRGDFLRNTLG